jgi:hypothetical protein
MCKRVVRAVRAVLEDEPYRSRFTFEVFGWESKQGSAAQKAYCFGAERHGFVVLDADGRALACRPGHDYGGLDIQEDLDRILAESAPPASPAAAPGRPPAR